MALCRAVCRGMKAHMELYYSDMLAAPVTGCIDVDVWVRGWGELWSRDGEVQQQSCDDVCGRVLDPSGVKASRANEIK